MAATKSAGRVSIRVLPDSTKFREDLKKTLDRIEKSMKVKIQVEPILDKKQLAEMKRQIEALAITIKPHIELQVPREKIEEIKQAIESMDPEVDVDLKLNTAGAAARIAALTRSRAVHIFPVILKGAAENFSKHLAAIAGASYITQEINKGIKFLRTIDTHAVAIAKQATLIGSVVAIASGLIQTVFALGDGLIKTTALLSVAPALLSSMGIAAAVFIRSLRDLKTELAELGPMFTDLGNKMSREFWDEARQPIIDMTNNLFPTLSEKMLLASTSMGKLTAQIADSVKEHVTVERFALMFDRVLESMDTVRGAVDPLVRAFTILGLHGTKYLNRLSKAIVGVTEDFANWLEVSYENGNLAKWTEEGITAFKEFGGIINGVWQVFGRLNDAMKAAGGPTLASLHRNLDSLASMMGTEEFQRNLTGVFRGMNSALSQIGRAIIDLGPSLGALAPTIERAFVSVGSTMSMLLGYFGQIIEHPLVRKGLDDLFNGINKGVAALAPSIEPFSIALGSVLTLIGTVLENVGHLVNTIMTEWGPALQRLSDTFDTLAEPLRIMLEDVVRELTPAINELVDNAIIPLLEWIRDHLIPAVSQFAKDVGPTMLDIAKGIGSAINDYLIPALQIVTDLFTDAEGEGSAFKGVLEGLIKLINDPTAWVLEFSVKGTMEGGGDLFKGMFENTRAQAQAKMDGEEPYWIDRFGQWFIDLSVGIGQRSKVMWDEVDWAPRKEGNNTFREGLQEKFDIFNNWANDTNESVNSWAAGVGELIGEGFNSSNLGIALAESQVAFDEWWGGLQGWWGDVETGWNNFWGGFGERNAKMDEMVNPEEMQLATAGIDIDLGELMTSFSEWWAGATEGWGSFWDGFGTKVSETTAGAREAVSTTLSEWTEGFHTTMADLGIVTDEGWGGFRDSISTKTSEINENVNNWLSDTGTNLMNGWNGMTEDASTGWSNLKGSVNTKTSEINENVNSWLSDTGTNLKNGWNGFTSEAGTGWTNFKNTINTKTNETNRNVNTWLSTQGSDIRNGFEGMVGDARTKFETFKQTIGNKFSDTVNNSRTKVSEIAQNTRNGFEEARTGARDKLEEMNQAIRAKLDSAVNWVRDLPNRLRNALSGESLYGSGQSLMGGFGAGIESMGETLRQKARNILQSIRNMFPSSPAKEGPFSGKGWTPYSGAALIDGFAEGMESRMMNAKGVARKMHTGISKELNSIQADATLTGDSMGSNDSKVTMNVYNPIAEPTSKTIARASSMIKLGGK